MKEVLVDTETFETIPGKTSQISPAIWRGKIDTLLYQLDELKNVTIERQAWLKEKGTKMQTLLLEMSVNIDLGTGPVRRRLSFEIEPVLIKRKKWKSSHKTDYTVVEEMNTSWKLFHDLLQAKLASARLGVVEIHHEFMPYIVTQLPDGRQGNFADFMDLIIESDRLNEITQLEDKSREPRKILEPEYKEVP